MPVHPTLTEIALRLALSLAAGCVIGLNREEHGAPAGMRTTILVCLAAALSMIEANLLLEVDGHTASSFSVMDVMRLPLGVLSGMGFIGAGAILRRDRLVHGITTAATLWCVTILGLCLGGGQLALGIAGTVIGILTLWGLKRLERRLEWERQAALVLEYEGTEALEEGLMRAFAHAGLRIRSFSRARNGQHQRLAFMLVLRERRSAHLPPPVIARLLEDSRFVSTAWQPDGFEPPWASAAPS